MTGFIFVAVTILAAVANCELAFWLKCEEEGFKQLDQLFQIVRTEVSKGCDKYANCKGNGKCITGGHCLCNEGFAGIDCGQSVTIKKGDDYTILIDEDTYGPVEDWLKEQRVSSVAVSWPSRSGISKVEAMEHCKNVWIDNPYKEICGKFATKSTFKEFTEMCSNMIMVTSQVNFAYITRDVSVYSCVEKIVDATKKECGPVLK